MLQDDLGSRREARASKWRNEQGREESWDKTISWFTPWFDFTNASEITDLRTLNKE